jgi:hypothetical protein
VRQSRQSHQFHSKPLGSSHAGHGFADCNRGTRHAVGQNGQADAKLVFLVAVSVNCVVQEGVVQLGGVCQDAVRPLHLFQL